MVHGYHVILPMYGFWLPNDPRGSWSDVIRVWEIAKFGPTTKSHDRRSLGDLSPTELRARDKARARLRYPAVSIDGHQAAGVGRGLGEKARKSKYEIWACSILPEHTHLVVARHSYEIEQVANLLKGAATSQLIAERLHPLAQYARPGKRPPRMWSEHQWKVYLDSEDAIEAAIQYVIENPRKEGKSQQSWDFVVPFEGLPKAWVTY